MIRQNNAINGYSEQIIVFIDVLGFSEAIRESASSRDNYDKVNNILLKLKELAVSEVESTQRANIPPIKISSFSDSIVASCPVVSELSFDIMLLIMCQFFLTTISHGFFLRGSLTIGPFQEDDGILFGPALVRAYEIERSLALWPRCVIDPFLIARHDIYPDGVWNKHQYILLGDDGLPFLDYLGYTFGHYFYNWIEERMKDNGHKHNENPEHLALTVLHGHKNAIFQAVRKAARKKESASTLFTKFFPLAAYHNKVIERFIDVSRPGRLDDLKKFAIEGGLEPAIVDNLEKEIVDDDASRWRSELIDLNSLLNEMWSTEIIPS